MERCGECEREFKNTKAYLEHVCEVTGFRPTQIEHQDVLTDGNFSKISKEALKRGDERADEDIHPAMKAAEKKKR